MARIPFLALTISTLAFSSQALAAIGVTESVYHDILPYTDPSVGYFPTDSSINAELAYVNGATPAETFINTATTFTYAGDLNTPTNTYLGADAAGAALTDTAPFYDSAVLATGTITVSTPGTYTVSIPGADDAERVYIGGTTVAEADYYGGGLSIPSSNTVTLSDSESFELFSYNTVYGANTSLTITGPGTVSFSTSVVPEPQAWALMLVGFVGLGVALRWRRTARALAA
jgi:hypothetical protein